MRGVWMQGGSGAPIKERAKVLVNSGLKLLHVLGLEFPLLFTDSLPMLQSLLQVRECTYHLDPRLPLCAHVLWFVPCMLPTTLQFKSRRKITS